MRRTYAEVAHEAEAQRERLEVGRVRVGDDEDGRRGGRVERAVEAVDGDRRRLLVDLAKEGAVVGSL